MDWLMFSEALDKIQLVSKSFLLFDVVVVGLVKLKSVNHSSPQSYPHKQAQLVFVRLETLTEICIRIFSTNFLTSSKFSWQSDLDLEQTFLNFISSSQKAKQKLTLQVNQVEQQELLHQQLNQVQVLSMLIRNESQPRKEFSSAKTLIIYAKFL